MNITLAQADHAQRHRQQELQAPMGLKILVKGECEKKEIEKGVFAKVGV